MAQSLGKARIFMSPSSGARRLDQYMRLRHSDGPNVDGIDAQARGDVGSSPREGCAFGEEVSTKCWYLP